MNKKFVALIILCEMISVVNIYSIFSHIQNGKFSIFTSEQIEQLKINSEFFFVIACVIQLITLITIVFFEAIVLCILSKKIKKEKVSMGNMLCPVVIGNIVLSVYNMLLIYILQINTLRGLKIFNLLPVGIVIKVTVIFAYIKMIGKQENDKKLKFEKNEKIEMILFCLIEYLYSLIGLFAI